MTALTLHIHRLRWLHLPTVTLLALLQRLPVIRAVVTTEYVISSSAGTVLKGIFAGAAAMGAVQTVAGATEINPAPDSANNPASAQVGVSFAAAVAITGAPAVAASYEIKGSIPPGITISGLVGDTVNAAALAFTGTPTTAGTFSMDIRAWKGPNKTDLGGMPTFRYTIEVAAAAGTAPAITTQPTARTATAGTSVSFSVAATGDPTPTFQWRRNGTAISGATAATFTISSVTAADAGNYSVVVTNAAGSVTSSAVALTVQPASSTPVISAPPPSRHLAPGANTSLSVTATGTGPFTYQWLKYVPGVADPTALSGETAATLSLSNVQAGDMGFYVARVTNASGSTDTTPAILTVSVGSSRLLNLSTRGPVAVGGFLTPGFVLSGTGDKELVVRAVGPQLTVFGVPGALADPQMNIIPQGSSDVVTSNDNWNAAANAAALRTATAAVGGFALAENSADASSLASLPVPYTNGSRGYTVRIGSAQTGQGGIAIAEVYDTDASTDVKLINLSTQGFSGTGINALVPGFVIGGPGPKRILLRVIGPQLGSFGVPNTMADPQLVVVPLNTDIEIARNDNWGGTTELKTAFAISGAFGLSDDASKDAALVVTLPPGGYTAVVSGADGGTGVVLVEAYDLDL